MTVDDMRQRDVVFKFRDATLKFFGRYRRVSSRPNFYREKKFYDC